MPAGYWETYYRGGALVSCPLGTGVGTGYTLEVREAWLEFFGALADSARVVDIGTGNGALLLIAKDAASAAGRRFELHGADLARIDPVRHVPGGQALFEGVVFHAGAPAEDLPFETHSVDAVTGQYALEYADVPAALAEAARVLRPGGRARFVLHHAESVVVRNAAASLADAHYVLNEERVLRSLRRYLEAGRRSPAAARSAWEALVQSGARLGQRARENPGSPVLAMATDVLRRLFDQHRQMTASQVEAALAAIERELRTHVHRLRDLVAVARSAAGMQDLCAQARQAGFDVREPVPQYHDIDKLVGWQWSMQSR
jgi:ubiquinone/menaquinone biosynthesis C-methylase UbiE